MKEKELYKKAVRRWGRPAQICMAVEECAELLVALTKFGRNTNGSTIDDVLEEIVDVEIMLKQLKLIFNYKYSNGAVDKFDALKKMKLERLEKLLENDK